MTNINARLTKLERALAHHHCGCPNSAELSWPGHQPNPHCPHCGGQRLIYPLDQHPRHAEPLMRKALPLIQKACLDSDRADLSRLTDPELHQIKQALLAVAQAEGEPS